MKGRVLLALPIFALLACDGPETAPSSPGHLTLIDALGGARFTEAYLTVLTSTSRAVQSLTPTTS